MKKIPQNEFNLLGRVGYIKQTFNENKPTSRTDVSLGVKRMNGEYDNFFITFIDTQKNNTAEQIANDVKVGDYIRATGSLSSFTKKITLPDGTKKKTTTLSLTGWGYKHVVFDVEQKCWFDKDSKPKFPIKSTKTLDDEPILKLSDEDFSDDLIGEDEIPF